MWLTAGICAGMSSLAGVTVQCVTVLTEDNIIRSFPYVFMCGGFNC